MKDAKEISEWIGEDPSEIRFVLDKKNGRVLLTGAMHLWGTPAYYEMRKISDLFSFLL